MFEETGMDKGLYTCLPLKPGVYLFKDADGNIMYVGKSRSLKVRVGSYFRSGDELTPAKQQMVANVAGIETIVTDTEEEALFLESTLIKKHCPPYNIDLRDDKSYSYVCIDYSKTYPEILRIRQSKVGAGRDRPLQEKRRLFGPFTSGSLAVNALWTVKKYFPICLAPNQKTSRLRACFNYAIHKCPGVCLGVADPASYRKTFSDIAEFLSGNTHKLEEQLKTEISEFAHKEQFEQALIRKHLLESIVRLHERQKVVNLKDKSADYVSFVSFGTSACVNILNIRHGSLYDQKNFLADRILSPAETIQQTLEKYYSVASDIPAVLYGHIPFTSGLIAVDSMLHSREFSIPLKHVQRGERLKLLQMGERNAQEYLFQHSASLEAETPIEKLCQILRIPYARGFRSEIYDISHIQGSDPVGSMVVFRDSEPDKHQYRKFKLEDLGEPNDFAHLEEMLNRRLKHTPSVIPTSDVGIQKVTKKQKDLHVISSEAVASVAISNIDNQQNKIVTPSTPRNDNSVSVDFLDSRFHGNDSNKERWPLPNLIAIDGGKGQLSIARRVLKKYQLSIPLIALAKREEEIFIPGKKDSLRLPRNNAALKLLQHMRDEAHRFGIAFHRKRHRETLFGSI